MVSTAFTKEWKMSDVVLKMMDSDELLYANKTILSAFSPFFKTLFGSNAESKQGVINLEGICYWPMLEILKVIHNIGRRFDKVNQSYTVDQIVQLWHTAEKADFPLIRQLSKHGICVLNRTDALDATIQCRFKKEKTGILTAMTYAEMQTYLKRETTGLVFCLADAKIIAEKHANVQQPNMTVAQAARLIISLHSHFSLATLTPIIFSINFTKKWEMSDVALKTKDSEELLYANKTVLAVQSPFFKKLLFGDFAEAKQDVVNLDGIEHWPMLEILKILHSVDRQFNQVHPVYSLTQLIQLWQTADGYDFPLIGVLCKHQIPKLQPAERLECLIQCGLHEQKSKILKNMDFGDIRKYLEKGVTDLVLSPADAMVILEKGMAVKKMAVYNDLQTQREATNVYTIIRTDQVRSTSSDFSLLYGKKSLASREE